MDGALKKQIITAVEPVFLSPMADQLTGFGQVSALTMIKQLFSNYVKIDKIDLQENSVKTMGPYNPAEPLARLIKKWKRGENSREQEGRQYLTPRWCPKVIPFWRIRRFSITTSKSGDVRPPTRRCGHTTSCFSLSTSRSEKIGNNRRKRGVHRGGAKHIWCTAYLPRRAS